MRNVSTNIVLGDDGVLRWVHVHRLWRDPTALLQIWRALGAGALVVWLLTVLVEVADGTPLAHLVDLTEAWLLITLGLTVLGLTGFAVYALVVGNELHTRFEMSARGVHHMQTCPSVGWLTAWASALAWSPGAVGAGVLAETRTGVYTPFVNVRRVVVDRDRLTVELHERLTVNEVYVDAEDDLEAVLAHIKAHVDTDVEWRWRR